MIVVPISKFIKMQKITFTYNGVTWVVLEHSFGYKQGRNGQQLHGTPIPQLVTLLLQYQDDDVLLDAAKSPGDVYDATLNYYKNGQIAKQVSIPQAAVVSYMQNGQFNPGKGNGFIVEEVQLLTEGEIA